MVINVFFMIRGLWIYYSRLRNCVKRDLINRVLINKDLIKKVLCFLFTRAFAIIEIIKLNSVFYLRQVLIGTGLIKTVFYVSVFLYKVVMRLADGIIIGEVVFLTAL